jgi:hypothetical protein
MQTLRALAIGLGLLAAITSAPIPQARAQETVSDYAQIGHALFCAQDVAELDKAVKLTGAQKETAESLMRGAAAQARSVYAKLMKVCQEKSEELQKKASDPEAYQAASKDYMRDYMKLSIEMNKQIISIEREALTDIRNVLKPEQIEKGWPAFERARRRLMLMNSQYYAMGRSPRGYIQAIKLSPADTSAAEEILARYELDLDPLLIERSHGLAHMQTEMMEKADFDWSGQDWQAMFQRPDLMAAKISKLNVRNSQAIEKALSDDGRRLFLRQRVGVEFAGWISRPASDERIKMIKRLPSLTGEQKDQLNELISKADDAMFEIALAGLRESDEAALREEAQKAEDVQTKAQERQQKSQAQLAALVKSMRAVLTAAQIEELDFSYGQEPGKDLFKTDRMPPEESEWNKDPSKEPDPAQRGGR